MLTNYLKTFFRSLLRFKIYSIINISGLTLGISTALFIGLWVLDELNFDHGYKDHDRIYEVINNRLYSDGRIESAYSTQGKLAEEMTRSYPEIEFAARADWPTQLLIQGGDKSLMQTTFWADASLIDVFGFNLIEGDASNPMPDEQSIALTKSTATRFFPNGSALGKFLKVDDKHEMRVTAVLEDNAANSSLQFDALLSFKLFLHQRPWADTWNSEESRTFVKLKAGADVAALNSKIKDIVNKNCSDCKNESVLYSFSDLHLNNVFVNGHADGGRISYVRLMSLVGFFIILIACINFMNLATARSATRSREIGIRKVVGAKKYSLTLQFIGEATILALASTAIAVALVQMLLPIFNSIANKQISLTITPAFVGTLFALGCIVGLIAGSYPALYLSSIRASSVLKGQNHFGGARLRQSLVVFQFALSVVLMISSVVVYQQLDFIREKNLGFERDNVIGFTLRNGVSNNKEAFKNEALQHPAIKNLTLAGNNPFGLSAMTTSIFWPGKPSGDVTMFRMVSTDKDFVSTMKMEIVEGRDFVDTNNDSLSYLVNETAVKAMGLTDPLGTSVVVIDGAPGKIVGVIKDWNNQDLKSGIDPVIVLCYPQLAWRGFAKIEGSKTQEAIAALTAIQKKFDPQYPFDYYFLDDRFEQVYESESTLQKLSLIFTVIAVGISCLGLFGLASFMAERRTKELGIRKVMGAEVGQLVKLLCTDFAKLVAISMVIGAPVAWMLMDNYLSEFTYHMTMTPMIFIGTGILLLMIAIVTVAWQSLKAATANPVKSLRSE
jgi:putative ABC transport system permease protein